MAIQRGPRLPVQNNPADSVGDILRAPGGVGQLAYDFHKYDDAHRAKFLFMLEQTPKDLDLGVLERRVALAERGDPVENLPRLRALGGPVHEIA